ncbi:CAP domain-containing protein, partial [Usnea florida]
PTTPPSSPQYTSDSLFTATILNSTNTYRTLYNASALIWNTSLATYATTWASKCQFTHSSGSPGENLAQGYANVTAAVDAWGDEGKHYDFNKGGFSESTGHFSQLVWKGSESVGCGRMECGGVGGVRGWEVVCEYWPAGNVEGEFETQVGREV